MYKLWGALAPFSLLIRVAMRVKGVHSHMGPTCHAQVLAHRGRFWMLLQNCCIQLWNFTNIIFSNIISGALPLSERPRVSLDYFRRHTWNVFYLATDNLLDMMTKVQTGLKNTQQPSQVTYDCSINQVHVATRI